MGDRFRVPPLQTMCRLVSGYSLGVFKHSRRDRCTEIERMSRKANRFGSDGFDAVSRRTRTCIAARHRRESALQTAGNAPRKGCPFYVLKATAPLPFAEFRSASQVLASCPRSTPGGGAGAAPSRRSRGVCSTRACRRLGRPSSWVTAGPAVKIASGARSSVGQSTGLLSRGSKVRILPGAPVFWLSFATSLQRGLTCGARRSPKRAPSR